MKKITSICIFLFAMVLGHQAYGLSFAPDTIFLNIHTQEVCETEGAYFTEWYGEIYCTTTPEEVLSEQELTTIEEVGMKIIQMIETTAYTKEEVLDMIQTYKTSFHEKNDVRNLAIAITLIRHITIYDPLTATIPAGCITRYDGCNTCYIMKDGAMACTEMACFVQQTPYCKVYEKILVVSDQIVTCTGVGKMDCLQIKEYDTTRYDGVDNDCSGSDDTTCRPGDPIPDIDITEDQSSGVSKKTENPLHEDKNTGGESALYEEKSGCSGDNDGDCQPGDPIPHIDITEDQSTGEVGQLDDDDDGDSIGDDERTTFYDSIEGFEYIPGYEWILRVEKHHLDPEMVPADGSSISWKLIEVLKTTPALSENI